MHRVLSLPLALACALAVSAAACAESRNDGAAPGDAGAVHARGFAERNQPGSHAQLLRAARWTPMMSGDDPNACGRCHEGTPARPSKIAFAAPGAPDCRSCHDQPGGVLACNTCHDATRSGAHAAHIAPSATHGEGFSCATCHPVPDTSTNARLFEGAHGNGAVEIAGAPSFDSASGTCTVACHDRGGSRPRPTWTDTTAMRCGDCHASPPSGHFPGACSTCHHEADATGTALAGGPLHLNGRVDLGDGAGTCGSCHGAAGDPTPTTGAHPSHANPKTTTPIACADCHVVPAAVLAPGHLDGVVTLSFGGRAVARSAIPTWTGTSCVGVACHGANMIDPPAVIPTWADQTGAASQCGACHGIPPSQHTTSTSCDRSTCHGDEIVRTATTLSISNTGRSLHIDGLIAGH